LRCRLPRSPDKADVTPHTLRGCRNPSAIERDLSRPAPCRGAPSGPYGEPAFPGQRPLHLCCRRGLVRKALQPLLADDNVELFSVPQRQGTGIAFPPVDLRGGITRNGEHLRTDVDAASGLPSLSLATRATIPVRKRCQEHDRPETTRPRREPLPPAAGEAVLRATARTFPGKSPG
jgi:hypothetical protein